MTQRQPHEFHLRTVLSARAAYVVIILLATIVEVVKDPVLPGAMSRLVFAFKHQVVWAIYADVLRNILLFTGFGAVWLVTSPHGKLRRAILRSTVLGFLLSCSVEALQVFSTRVPSWLDVLTNTLGTLIGALGAGVLVAMVRAMRGHRTAIGVPLFVLAIGQLGALLAEAMAPWNRFDPRTMLGGPLQRIRSALQQSGPLSLSEWSPVDAALAMPAGAFVTAALIELGVGRWAAAVLAATGGGVLVAAFVMISGAAGHPLSVNNLLSRVAGLTAGAILAALAVPRVSRVAAQVQRARIVAAMLVLAVLAWTWRPYLVKTDARDIAYSFSHIALSPLSRPPYTLGLPSVAHVIHLSSLGMCVGALLAVWPVRRQGPWRYVWPAALLALVVELGHGFLVARPIDVTGFLLLFAGAWLGDAVVRRAGFTAYGELAGPWRLPRTPPQSSTR